MAKKQKGKKPAILLIFGVLAVLMLASLASAHSRVQGSGTLAWSNYPGRPQLFIGNVAGGLAGPITLTSTTDYDAGAVNVGVTHADVTATLNGAACEGFYAGSNVNAGRNAGTFNLICDDGNVVEGVMYGVNDQLGNINMNYDAVVLTPIAGPTGPQGSVGETGQQGLQGEQGIPGLQGDQGIQGEIGLTGAQGPQGIQGETGLVGANGAQGLPGVQGEVGLVGPQGVKGDTGLQGIQGLQGVKGDKGDTGSVGPVGPVGPAGSCTCSADQVLASSRQYSLFQPFWGWYDSGMVCENGAKQCSGTSAQLCVNYQWTTAACQYGCAAGVCKPKPTESCIGKATTYECTSLYGYPYSKQTYTNGLCQSGHGTATSCDLGFCQMGSYNTYCYYGCNVVSKQCNMNPV